MRLSGLFAAVVVSGAMGAVSAAQADVIYQFTGQVTGAQTKTLHETLTVTDQAYLSGQLNFSIMGNNCGFIPGNNCVITGDPTGFVSISDGYFSSSTALGILKMNVAFNSDGTLTGSFDEFG